MRAARAYGIGLGMTDLDVSPGWWRRPLLAPVVGLFGRQRDFQQRDSRRTGTLRGSPVTLTVPRDWDLAGPGVSCELLPMNPPEAERSQGSFYSGVPQAGAG